MWLYILSPFIGAVIGVFLGQLMARRRVVSEEVAWREARAALARIHDTR